MPVAVVTGSSSGIGRQTAIKLAQLGYSVVLHARRNLAGLQQTAHAIEQLANPLRPLCVLADIRCPRACRDLVDTAFAWQGRVDLWVNNAGADVLTTGAKDLPMEQRLKLLLEVDVEGTVRLCRLVASRMLALNLETASIINLGWDQANLGMEGDQGQLFCTVKSAVMAFSQAFALCVAPQVRVNCVAPGWIKTSWGETSASQYWDQRAKGESMLARWGTPDDVASVIAWLASPEARFVNGQCINVNGGRRFHQ